MELEVKKAQKKDLKEVASIMIEEFKQPPWYESAPVKNVMKSLEFFHKKHNVHVAKDSKHIHGVIIFKVEQYWEGPVVIIEDLAVTSSPKNVEICLMHFIECYAKDIGAHSIWFATHKKTPALNFYKKLGYESEKTTIIMRKELKK